MGLISRVSSRTYRKKFGTRPNKKRTMAVGKNKRLNTKSKKGGKKKVVDPFIKKEWFDVKAPNMFKQRNIGKTLVTKTIGNKVAADGLKHRVYDINQEDLQGQDGNHFRKFRLVCEDVQGKNCLTNFHGMGLVRDKNCEMVRKKHTMISACSWSASPPRTRSRSRAPPTASPTRPSPSGRSWSTPCRRPLLPATSRTWSRTFWSTPSLLTSPSRSSPSTPWRTSTCRRSRPSRGLSSTSVAWLSSTASRASRPTPRARRLRGLITTSPLFRRPFKFLSRFSYQARCDRVEFRV